MIIYPYQIVRKSNVSPRIIKKVAKVESVDEAQKKPKKGLYA